MKQTVINPQHEPATGSIHGIHMQNILKTIERVAVSDLSVRIVGENGSGKEWLARLIHQLSARTDHTFVHFDCSAIPFQHVQEDIFGSEVSKSSRKEIRYGLLETANGGTIYFDKISSLPSHVQMKIATAFERQHFRRVGGCEEIYINVRAIEGVNIPYDENTLRRATEEKHLRRIGQVCINMPPLRERREDIPFLVKEFIKESNTRTGVQIEEMTPDALALCLAYRWPGNIRELQSVIEYAAMVCPGEKIFKNNLPEYLRRESSEASEYTSVPETLVE